MTSIAPINFPTAITLGSDYKNDYAAIDLSRGATAKGGPQVARFFVTGDWTSGTTAGTLHVVLLDKTGAVRWSDTATITPTTVVSSSGRNVATVSFSTTSSDKIDLLGSHCNAGAEWRFAPTAFGDFDSDVEVSVAISHDI